MKISTETTLRDIVVNYPQTRAFFEARGLDYCCHGQASLQTAAADAGMDAAALLADLQKAAAEPAPRPADARDWSAAYLTELTDHILEVHHSFMRRQLPRIESLVIKVLAAHPRHSALLRSLQRVFAGLRAEIEEHLMKEEVVLFPYIKQLDEIAAGRQPFAPMHCGTVAYPIGQMEHEHDAAGAALVELRKLSSDYQLPDDACPTFAELYQAFQNLEADLHEHIHLENNILFPRAVASEQQLAGQAV